MRSQATAPLPWAFTQRNLGLALKTYGVMAGDTAAIYEGADAYRAALEVFTPESSPENFAQTSAILGIALMEIAKTNATVELLEEARVRFEDANAIFGPMNADQDAYFRGRIEQIDEMLGR